ncbi:MAG: hypothetical protein WCH75_30250 [Candidatus Binatia bacterium]
MGMTLKIADLADENSSTSAEADYSDYTLQQLLIARYRLDAGYDEDADGENLEAEIQRRCARFQQGSADAGLGSRYRLYGFMFGVFFLAVSTGPFVAVEFLDFINLLVDDNGDNALLSGVWAMFTLPFAVMVFMIGGIMDVERIGKWFNL